MTTLRHMLRKPAVMKAYGRSHASVYVDIKRGVFPPPVRMGMKASAWPEDEVAAVIDARIAGRTDDEIRELVSTLIEARKAGRVGG
ncbi:MAG: phage transcriptional regulator, AlpA [Betaproteobacteria bacterium]|nr:phage transcriptional regulator, AlpA [Betaproteobacteria bacterium]